MTVEKVSEKAREVFRPTELGLFDYKGARLDEAR